jgi:hypothetical protein
MEYDRERKLNKLGDDLRKEYKEIIVDFILHDAENHKILAQKRSETRTMFPGAWEFPGGHLEPHETLTACIKRLVYEEGQMFLNDVVDMVHLFTWDSDKDVVNLQFIVNATGNFAPNKDKISEHRLIDADGLGPLLDKGKESPIYRGAFYAFEYLKMQKEDRLDMFQSVLFFDQVVADFFNYMRCYELPPKVVVGKENEKKFSLDKQKNLLSISPSFLRHYDKFGCASIILHLIFHNYQQDILSYDDVKAIRGFMGKNLMFYVDIVADMYTYLYLERYYGFDENRYRALCYQLLEEYRAGSVDESKFTRLLGSLLTINNRVGQSFDVLLPVLGDKGQLCVMQFNKSLNYKSVPLDKVLYRKSSELVTKPSISEGDYSSTIKKLITTVKKGK